MKDDVFERELRSFVRAGAPSEVPPSLAQRIAGVTDLPAPRRWWVPVLRLAAAGSLIAALVLGLFVLGPFRGAPTAVPPLIGSYITQTDGLYGYAVDRPAGWQAVDDGDGREYLSADPGHPDLVTLLVTNYRVVANTLPPQGSSAQWSLFEQNPTLSGWTAGIERLFQTNGIAFTRLESTRSAVLYLLPKIDVRFTLPEVQVVAFIISDGQPLGMTMIADGTYGSLEALRSDGLYGAFLQMVQSARAIAADPSNVNPPLSGAPTASNASSTADVIARLPLPHPDAQTASDGQTAVTSGAIWVADARGSYLVRIDVATNTVTDVPIEPASLAAGDAGLWMISPVGGAPGPATMDLSRVDLTTGRVARVASVPPIGRIAVGLGAVWQAADDIRVYDPDSGTLLRSFPNPGIDIAVACGALWSWGQPSSASAGGAVLRRLDPQTGTVLEAFPVPIEAHRLVQRGDTCWTTDGSTLIGIQPGQGIVATHSLASIQIAGDTIWQWTSGGAVQQIDPVSGTPSGPVWQLPTQDLHVDAKGQPDWRILSAGGSLWVLNGDEIVRYAIPGGAGT